MLKSDLLLAIDSGKVEDGAGGKSVTLSSSAMKYTDLPELYRPENVAPSTVTGASSNTNHVRPHLKSRLIKMPLRMEVNT